MPKHKILFIGDPIPSLHLATDTSIAFCECALNLDFEVFWCEKKDISLYNYEIIVNRAFEMTKATVTLPPEQGPRGSRGDVSSCGLTAGSSFLDPVVKPRGDTCTIKFSEFTHCFIRPDPPFDEAYKDLCWILNTQSKVKIYNKPSALLNFHEKSFQFRALSEGMLEEKNIIPTCVTNSLNVVKNFLNEHNKKGSKQFVTKPWLGHGGEEIMLWKNQSHLIKHIRHTKYKLIVQPYLEEIHIVGDRRVLFVNAQLICSYVRFPKDNCIVSNLPQGGYGLLRDMTPSQEILCQKLSQFLLKHSIVLAGVDLIGEKIGEINITSPTGFRSYEKFSGTRLIQNVFEKIIGF